MPSWADAWGGSPLPGPSGRSYSQLLWEGMGLMLRLRWLVAGIVGLVSLGVMPAVATAEGCPNEQFRTGLSAGLPDCRAYELVSPVEKNGGAVRSADQEFEYWESSVNGAQVVYSSTQGFADSKSTVDFALPYLASRDANGWSTQALLPSQAATGFVLDIRFGVFSSDLSSGVLTIRTDAPPLVSGEPQNNQNLFVRNNDDGSYRLIDVTPAGIAPEEARLLGASSDLSHVVFEERAQLTANAPAGQVNLYEWNSGTLSLLSVSPEGTALVGEEPQGIYVSEDGSRVVFGMNHCLYLRENDARTVQLDAPGMFGNFEAASSDFSKIFFSDDASAGLTGDTVPGSGMNLYEYDLSTGRLIDLTPSAHVELANGGEGDGVPGVARDGSYVYFIAHGSLVAGATAGQRNLYVWHDGVTSFIATGQGLVPFGSGILGGPGSIPGGISSDGTHLAFESEASLTGYDNTDANTGQADTEVFLYDAITRRLVCASCDPSGARPIGSSLMSPPKQSEIDTLGELGYRQRFLSPDGSRLFFNSSDALVPSDSNGRQDVYEYEGGQAHLISGGTGREDATFVDASASGNDVFFVSTQQLVGQDQDQQFDLYDARVGGGFPSPSQPVGCTGEGCRAAPGLLPVPGMPGSLAFTGAGNLPSLAQTLTKKKASAKPRPKAKKTKKKRARRLSHAKKQVHGRRGNSGHSTGKRG
jgi:Tol biopolymer transport system component